MATVSHDLEDEREHLKPLALGSLDIPAEAHTYPGFLDWAMSGALPEKLRVTYIAGVVSIDMTEENIDSHVAVKAGVYRTLLNLIAEQDFGRLCTDGVLIGNEAAKVSNNPDGVAFRWSTFEAGRVQYLERKGQPRALIGSPDWVLEIVSDSSVGKDTKRLREAYHRAGIPEYWLIDARKEEIEFHIFAWRENSYAAAPSKEGWLTSKVFGQDFRLTRVRDRDGAWTYNLESRPQSPKTKSRKKS